MTIPTIRHLRFDDQRIVFELNDEREVSLPIAQSARLSAATAAERAQWTIGHLGQYVHWPAIDEDIAIWDVLGIDEASYLRAVRDAPVS